jgi:hypothetical protein
MERHDEYNISTKNNSPINSAKSSGRKDTEEDIVGRDMQQ